MKKKILVDRKGIIHTVYNDDFHLLLRNIGKVEISKRIGDVYAKGGDWFVRIENNTMCRTFGPFSTKREAIKKEEQYIEKNNFLLGE